MTTATEYDPAVIAADLAEWAGDRPDRRAFVADMIASSRYAASGPLCCRRYGTGHDPAFSVAGCAVYQPELGKAIICPYHGFQLGITCPVCSGQVASAVSFDGPTAEGSDERDAWRDAAD